MTDEAHAEAEEMRDLRRRLHALEDRAQAACAIFASEFDEPEGQEEEKRGPGRPPRDRKQQTVHLDPDTVKRLKVYAVMHDKQISEVAEAAISSFLPPDLDGGGSGA